METFKIENVNFTGNNPQGKKEIIEFVSDANVKAKKLQKIGSDFNRNSRYQNFKKVADYIVSGQEINTNNVHSALHHGSRDFEIFLEKLNK